MSKEIKRALWRWPVAASAAIIAAGTIGPSSQWFHRHDGSQVAAKFASASASWVTRHSALASQIWDDVSIHSDPRPPERTAAGRLGLRLPQRLDPHRLTQQELGRSITAAGMDSMSDWLPAPVLDPARELAGYAGPFPLTTTSTNPIAPTPLAPGIEAPSKPTDWSNRIDWSGPIAQGLLHRIAPAITHGSALSGLQRWLPTSPVKMSDGASDVLPSSIRVLAKPVQPPQQVYAWPQARQLRLDLATLSSQGQLARAMTSDSGLRLASRESARFRLEEPGSGFNTAVGGVDRTDNSTPQQRAASAIVMGRWADQVDAKLEQLRQLPRLADPHAGSFIRELSTLAEAGLQLGEKLPARDQQIHWMRAAHSLARRTSVWGAIWHLSQASDDVGQEVPERIEMASSSTSIRELVHDLRTDLPLTGDASGWNTFLLLEPISEIETLVDYNERALLAQRFLSRLHYQGLSGAHVRWLDRASVRHLAEALHPLTMKPVDYVDLLTDIERQESDTIDLASLKVTEALQSLRYTDRMPLVRVAKAIDLNYRNANVRTAISAKLLDRLLPDVPAKTDPINRTILGSRVRGTSQTDSQLSLTLIPSDEVWKLTVASQGQVSMRSRSTQSGVQVHTTGQSHFVATTPIEITRAGMEIGSTSVDVQGGNRLRGIDTRYDGWPLLGPLVQAIAKSRYDDTRATATRIMDESVRSEVSEQFQNELRSKSTLGINRLDEFVFGPLGRLNLNPRVIDQRTTETRLIARYRVAGDWQLAAHTPRPRAYSDSWMSMQLHQSALNNLLERLLPHGQPKTIGELHDDTRSLFAMQPSSLPEDVPADAAVCFAPTRPITLEFDEGQVWLTLRVVSLSRPGSSALRRFIVRASYRPTVDGLDARLVRQGHLRISGPSMSMRQRIPVRAIFNKILAEDRELPLTLPQLTQHPAISDLVVTQLELRDGWIAISIGPEPSVRVASRP